MIDSDSLIKIEEFNILSNKYKLRETAEEFLIIDDPIALQHHLVGILLNQILSRVGLKKYRQKAKEVLFTEFLQLYDIGIFSPIHKKNLSKEQISNTLRAISVIKEKCDSILKECICADGRKQHD